MAEAIRIRRPEKTEYEQWLHLWDGYNSFYKRSGPTALPQDVTRRTWERFFDPDEPVHALVAAQGDLLVGLVHYIFHRNTTMLRQTCYLQDLYTEQTARGRGVGRALIEGVYDRARQAGAERVYWHTHESNDTAMKLYDLVAEHSGFVLYRKNL